MLMQSFLSADDLGITEPQRQALMKTLVLLETGKLVHVRHRDDLSIDFEAARSFSGQFNMNSWSHTYFECGTICCIGGTAELIGDVDFEYSAPPGSALYNLFYPQTDDDLDDDDDVDWEDITPAQAARALRSYLNCGNPNWADAVSA